VERDYISFIPFSAPTDGFDPALFGRLAALEAGSFWFRSRNRLIISAIRRRFPGARNFLEIGVGTGYVLSAVRESFPEMTVAGGDLFESALVHAAERLPSASLYQFDARDLPFREEFDLVGAFDVLEHVEQDEQVLTEMLRATKPGGGIIVTVPQHPSLWSHFDVVSHHRRRYTATELEAKLRRVGVDQLFITSFLSFLLPIMFVRRRLLGNIGRSYNAEDEFRLPSLADRLLEVVTTAERICIDGGARLPVGGSLIAVGRRQ
jgi:ubiquinone/menaquinone biosynthesis C-methylase UbiE